MQKKVVPESEKKCTFRDAKINMFLKPKKHK